MGVNYFTDEQVKLLEANPYIDKVSNKSIKYSQTFKEEFWNRYSNGETPSMIISSFGIEGFEDQRQFCSGRPSSKEKSPEEEIEYLKRKISYQQQQIEFLKKIGSVERMTYWKQQQKNTKLSKK